MRVTKVVSFTLIRLTRFHLTCRISHRPRRRSCTERTRTRQRDCTCKYGKDNMHYDIMSFLVYAISASPAASSSLIASPSPTARLSPPCIFLCCSLVQFSSTIGAFFSLSSAFSASWRCLAPSRNLSQTSSRASSSPLRYLSAHLRFVKLTFALVFLSNNLEAIGVTYPPLRFLFAGPSPAPTSSSGPPSTMVSSTSFETSCWRFAIS
jgi:hypothetical protein